MNITTIHVPMSLSHFIIVMVIVFQNKDDQSSFCQLGGLASLSRLLLMYLDPAFALSKTKSSNTLPLKYAIV